MASIYYTYGIIIAYSFFLEVLAYVEEGPYNLFLRLQPITLIPQMITIFYWIWTVANKLQTKIGVPLRMGTLFFKICFTIPLSYLFFVGIYFIVNREIPFNVSFIWIPHLISILSIIYCISFSVRTIKVAETNKAVSFDDYLGEIFLIFLFPVGIWSIQPRINKLATRLLI